MSDKKTSCPNGLSYIELDGYKLGDLFEYVNQKGEIKHYVVSYLHKSMKNSVVTILFPDGFSENFHTKFLKNDKKIGNINWWKIHDLYIDEANMYLSLGV